MTKLNFAITMIVLSILLLLLEFANAETTYTKDAKPIFKNRCALCHNEYMPDRNWLNYDQAFKHRSMIKAKMLDRSMPPGNSTGMTEDERKIIIKWVDDGGKK